MRKLNVSDEELAGAEFRRASDGDSDADQYVEVAFISGGVAVRDSKDPSTVLLYTDAEWDAFIKGAKKGEFDRRKKR